VHFRVKKIKCAATVSAFGIVSNTYDFAEALVYL